MWKHGVQVSLKLFNIFILWIQIKQEKDIETAASLAANPLALLLSKTLNQLGRLVYFSWGFILALSYQVWGSHSPCTYLVYTLQAGVGFFFLYVNLRFWLGFMLSLTDHISGSHSPCTYVVYTLQVDVELFFSVNLRFSLGFIFSLSNQVSGSHSPCTYLVYTLQADVGIFFFSYILDFH